MKRRKTLGMLSTQHGVVRITHHVVAASLIDSQQQIKHLKSDIDKEIDRRCACEHAASQMDGELAALRSHWWVRVGRMLHVIGG
jgi:hypothetical protein